MGFWSKLFGSSDVIDAGINAADKMFYTDEEKADGKRLLLKAYEPFKLAQRFLAMIFCIPYSLAWLVTFVSSYFTDVAKQIEMLTNPVGVPSIVLAIAVFYFGGGAIESFKKKQ